MSTTALKGVRILDLSRILAGPWCTQNLSDLGADVIKVENPKGGDDTRGWGPPFLPVPDSADAFSAYFMSCNRGKRSIAIDFSKPEGSDLVKRMARDADMVVENYKVGTLARYGLDYETLRKENPRLIYLSITGYGQTGPMAPKPGYDYVFQGYGGLMSYTGLPDGMESAGPLRVGASVIDLMTGMYATVAVLAALVERGRTGQGEYIDVALSDVSIAINANQNMNYLVSGEAPKRLGNAHPNLAPYEVFACADGFLILAVGNDEQFKRLCEKTGRPELAQDERFTTNAGRLKNLDALRPLVAEIVKTKPRAEWGSILEGIGISWGPINTLDLAFDEVQVKHRLVRQDIAHPIAGGMPTVRNPATPVEPISNLAPPLLGEHTDQVLEELGLSKAEAATLAERKIVKQYVKTPNSDSKSNVL